MSPAVEKARRTSDVDAAAAKEVAASEGDARGKLEFGDSIDEETFGQILEMDEPDNHEFSQGIVYDFFSQAQETFKEIDEAIASRDLDSLSSRGHFLKGSSATLGFIKVQASCEKIQRYGKKENLDGTPGLEPEYCLTQIEKVLRDVKKELAEVESMIRGYYGDDDG